MNSNDAWRKKGKLLLHACCGPCSTSVLERLSDEYSSITVFFYNPNITDAAEYERRKEVQKSFIRQYMAQCIDFIEGSYEPEVFYQATKGLEQEGEGGSRCEICFRLRLAKTAEYAAKYGYEQFATTLSVSPHKDFKVIQRIGSELGRDYDVDFLAEDFKKKGGFQRSIELSKKFGLYRQNYCGCFFSKAGRKIK